jgi:hypothetical protein
VEEFAATMAEMAAGRPAREALDARYVDNYGLAGDPAGVRAGIARFAAVGVTELVVTLVGSAPEKTAALMRDVF